jgi:adenylate cyclase
MVDASASPPMRQRWSKPLRMHLSFIIVALLVAISAALLALAYRQGTRAALSAAKEQMDLLSDQTLDLYESIFRDGKAVVTIASVLPSFRTNQPADLNSKHQILLKALQSSPHLDGVYVAYPDGSFVQVIHVAENARWRHAMAAPSATAYAMRTVTPAANGQPMSAWSFFDTSDNPLEARQPQATAYDPRKRLWYQVGAAKPEPQSVGPYVAASTNTLTFSLVARLEADPTVVFGADVLIDNISAMLAEQAVSRNAKGYVFDGDGRLVVHSDPAVMEEIAKKLADGSSSGDKAITSDPVFPAVAALLRDKQGDQNACWSLLSAVRTMLPGWRVSERRKMPSTAVSR